MFILETSACTDASVLAMILFIKKLIKVLSIIVPAILILLLSIDFAKAVISNSDDGMKKAQHLALKRLIYGVIVFFIPMIINVVFGLIDSNDVSKSCFSNADDLVVSTLRQVETEKIITNETEKKELIEAAKKSELAADKEVKKLKDSFSSQTTSNNSTAAQKIVSVAKEQAWPLGTSSSTYHNKYYKNKHAADCGAFAKMVFNKATNQNAPNMLGTMLKNKQKGSKTTKLNKAIKKYGLTAYAWDGSMNSLIPGDLMVYKKAGDTSSGSGQHIMVYLGKTGNKYLVAEASHPKHYYGHLATKTAGKGQLKQSNYAYYYIIRAN